MTAMPRLLTALIVAAFAFSPALSLAQPIVSDVANMATWGLALVKAAAILFIIGGCVAVASGRSWGGAAIAIIGVIAAAKADTIAAFFGI